MQNLQQENNQRGKSALKMGGISVQEHNIVIPGISLCQKWGKIRIFHSTIPEGFPQNTDASHVLHL